MNVRGKSSALCGGASNDPAVLAVYARAEYLLDNYPGAASSAYAVLAPRRRTSWPCESTRSRLWPGRPMTPWMAWRGVIAHPNEPLQHRVYARLLQRSRQCPSALLVVDEALRLNPASADAVVLRGSMLHDMSRNPECIRRV